MLFHAKNNGNDDVLEGQPLKKIRGDKPPFIKNFPIYLKEAIKKLSAPPHNETDEALKTQDFSNTNKVFFSESDMALNIGKNRLPYVISAAIFGFLVVGIKLVDVSIIHNDGYGLHITKSNIPQKNNEVFANNRADILDRNGHVLAKNLDVPSAYINAEEVLDIDDYTTKITAILPDIDAEKLKEKLALRKKFNWVKRHITPDEKFQLHQLGLPGLYFQDENIRLYPHRYLASHIIGYVGTDNVGLAGLERAMNTAIIDGGKKSTPLSLTLDISVQHIVHSELQKVIGEYNAIGGTAIVLDAKRNEVVSMVSLPDFDINNFEAITKEQSFNRATLGTYELGSTFKIINSASALESGTASLKSLFDARKPLYLAGHVIRDYHAKKRILTVPEIFIYSSNIGSAQMAIQSGKQQQTDFFKKLGLFNKLPIIYPERQRPQYPKRWGDIHLATTSYGHGISVTPLHLVTAVDAILDDGIFSPPKFIKDEEEFIQKHKGYILNDVDIKDEKILSDETVMTMRKLMRLNVLNGSGRGANVKGYLVGGKTGTSEKTSRTARGYEENKLVSSFIAAFPMHDPAYIVYVMVDEPKNKEGSKIRPTGGVVAAPTAGRIIERIAPVLKIWPLGEREELLDDELHIDLPDDENRA